MYTIPLALWVCHDTRSILAFPLVCISSALYFYFQRRKDTKYTIQEADQAVYQKSKHKALERREMLRYLWMKHSDQVKISYIYIKYAFL